MQMGCFVDVAANLSAVNAHRSLKCATIVPMVTKVLIVDPDITFAVGIKRALEQAGAYRVTAFANGQSALDLLRSDPPDVLVLDFNVADMDIAALIVRVREIQPSAFILVSPRTGDQIARMQSLDVQGSVTKPYLARQLIPVIRESVSAKARLAKAAQSITPPAIQSAPQTVNSAQKNRLLSEPPIAPDDTFQRQVAASLPDKPATPSGLRKTLASVVANSSPTSESATVGDLISGKPLVDPPTGRSTAVPADLPEASAIATAALDTLYTMPIDTFTLKAYVEEVERQSGHSLTMPAEPSFVESAAGPMADPVSAPPITTEPPAEPPIALAEAVEVPLIEPPLIEPITPPEPIAATALRLTQLSVQLAARATVLTRDETVVATAGDLSDRAMAGIVETILQAWQNTTDESSALIRYVQVPGVGDFLLYSTQSVDALRLSMIFPAETPLRVIRKQAQQLIEALDKTDAPPAESEADKTLLSRPTDLRPPEALRPHEPISPTIITPAPAADNAADGAAAPIAPAAPRAQGPLSTYAFMWLPRRAELSTEQLTPMRAWLEESANAHSWQIEGIDVQPAYISLQISLAANETPGTAVETLMNATAERADVSDLWADAYYVAAPGRAVTQQEITQFMSYRREAEQLVSA